MGRCLLFIDVQKGFVSSETEYILSRMKELIDNERFDKVIATQFINPKDGPYRRFIKWNKLSVPPETDVLDFVKERADRIFVKNIYSAVSCDLLEYIENNGITEIFLSGIDTDCCVLKTAADLFERNIDVKILTHYTASNGGKESHYAAIRVLKRMIGEGQIIRRKHL